MEETKRIGNLEYRKMDNYIEIIHWVPNSLYGKEDEFEKTFSGSYKKNGTFYDEECFKNPETCYTVAWLEIKEEPNIISCGLRAFQLDEQDDKDFKLLVIYAYQYAHKLWKYNH